MAMGLVSHPLYGWNTRVNLRLTDTAGTAACGQYNGANGAHVVAVKGKLLVVSAKSSSS